MLLAIIYNLLVGLVLKWFPMQVAGTKFLGVIYLGAQKSNGVQMRSGTILALAVGCASLFSTVQCGHAKEVASSHSKEAFNWSRDLLADHGSIGTLRNLLQNSFSHPCGRLPVGFLCDIIDGPLCIFEDRRCEHELIGFCAS